VTLAPPFAYYGGKTTLAERIVAHLPDHGHYVEPFAGSLAVLLAKPISDMETVNDIDGALMTFWRVLRDQPEALIRASALTPHSRAEHATTYELTDDMPELETARRVWMQLSQGRAGTRRRTGWRHYVNPVGSSSSMPDYLMAYVARMDAVAERLHHVSLESRPALELIERYGREPDVLLYCDPPYLASTRGWGNNYKHEMRTEQEHVELLDALLDCRAAVVLSGYPSDLYESAFRDAFTDWYRVELAAWTGNGIRDGRTKTDGDRVEVLWSNRPFGKQGVLDFGEVTT
jgi:DNA adenine methylase